MSDYNTMNPVPSIDPRDLDDNAKAFDRFLQSDAASEPDRLGVQRKTWHQMELDAAALVSPNVSALAALTPAVNLGFFFNATSPVGMGTYTLSSFTRGLGPLTTGAAYRTAIGAISSADNITGSAAKLTTPRNIALTGDGSWNVNFDGSAGVTAALTLANTGVAAGTYGSVTVNAKGLVTGASTITPIANGGTGSAATAMANLTLQNSWVLAGGGRAAYRKLIDFVFLELRITSGTSADSTILATLPVGFRPASQVVIPVSSPPNTALSTTVAVPRININTDGTITCSNCSSGQIQVCTVFSLT